MDLKEEAVLGPAMAEHWYYVAKGRAVRSFLGGGTYDSLLDVGAGSGLFTRQLLDEGVARSATCVDPGYPADRTETYHGCEIAFVRNLDRISQRLILMMDVLEHVDDDVGLLRAYTGQMPDDARVLITVPAFQVLWSGHDVFLEHKRRYTLAAVEQLVGRAGLRVHRSRYFFAILLPVVAMTRLADRLSLQMGRSNPHSVLTLYPPLLNTLLIRIHDLERTTLFGVNRLAGLSVFCLASKA